MGLFDFLFGKRSNFDVEPDKIWLTEEAKFAGIAGDVAKGDSKGAACVLLVAHFPDVFERLEQVAAKQWLVPVKAVLAEGLSGDAASALSIPEGAVVQIIVAERHPLPAEDDRVENFARALPCRACVRRHVSLDDPLLQQFASGWVKEVLGKMGMKDGEAIESSMVTRRIRHAQDKIASRVLQPKPANTAAEWMQLNLPE